jgi:hypothetical protein
MTVRRKIGKLLPGITLYRTPHHDGDDRYGTGRALQALSSRFDSGLLHHAVLV